MNAAENPVEKYPKPDFPRQPQEVPGLASKMTPLPDHGEKSYKGSGRLAGKGQKKSNKEIRKPKAEKPLGCPATSKARRFASS